MGARPADDFDPQIRKLIRIKVSRLIGRYGFRKDDEEDLRQEVSMHVVKGLRQHDPTRAKAKTYAEHIVDSKLANIIEGATAQKRDRRREQPLEAASETVLLDGENGRDQLDTALDVKAALAKVADAELRWIATLFMKHGTEAAVVRQTGFNRRERSTS
jgi:DNA-directed RNA polymerase specialized sigma24 family protein